MTIGQRGEEVHAVPTSLAVGICLQINFVFCGSTFGLALGYYASQQVSRSRLISKQFNFVSYVNAIIFGALKHA